MDLNGIQKVIVSMVNISLFNYKCDSVVSRLFGDLICHGEGHDHRGHILYLILGGDAVVVYNQTGSCTCYVFSFCNIYASGVYVEVNFVL